MKYIIAILAIFMTVTEIQNSNLCWYFQNNAHPRLHRRMLSHNSHCTCECWQYEHTKGTNNQYKCTNCEHRLTPPDPLSADGPQFKRYYQADEETDIEKEIEKPVGVSSPAKTFQHPLSQQWRETSYTAPFTFNGFNR